MFTKEVVESMVIVAGCGQLGILIASSLVPSQLKWKQELAGLKKLHRQMHWVYAGYVVIAIFSFGLMSAFCADEFVSGSKLSRALSAYIAVFWGIRLMLQAVFDLKSSLDAVWKRCGFHLLTLAFTYLTILYTSLAFGLLN